MDLPVVNLPPFPNLFLVFPFLLRSFNVDFKYLSSIQRYIVLKDGILNSHGVFAICSGDHVNDSFSSM